MVTVRIGLVTDGMCSGEDLVWYVVHKLEKSGLCFVVRLGVGFSFCVDSTTRLCAVPWGDRSRLSSLWRPVANNYCLCILSKKLLPVHSKFQLQIKDLNVPIVVTLHNFKASLKASSSRWGPASSSACSSTSGGGSSGGRWNDEDDEDLTRIWM